MLGAGIAGLSFALNVPFPARILLVTKGALGESNTRYAQGGLAAAVGPDDSPELHLDDTIAAGAGLVDREAAWTMVSGGRDAVDWLESIGTRFDRNGDSFALGMEGAHQRPRVLHAGGDATGAEIERALVAKLHDSENIAILEEASAVDLHTQNGRCVGAKLATPSGTVDVASSVTVLAMGGAGRLWATTSNPEGATGDGIALAYRAGAEIADLEFAQFHPTVLDLPGTEPFLISEAVRGDGAWLRNDAGERFMVDVDPRAELASRDIVARSIQTQQTAGSRVWLDLRHLDSDVVRMRFPTIARYLQRIGLDLATDPIPVSPAAHYFMGGVVASPRGETSIPGLLAVGEVSCTGVHGANRLASNSLLEGLVFGRSAAASLEKADLEHVDARAMKHDPAPEDPQPTVDTTALRHRLQSTMRANVSVVRSETSLQQAIADATEIIHATRSEGRGTTAANVHDMALIGREIARSALQREESRGGHFRSDFPLTDPQLEGRHQLLFIHDDCSPNRRFGPLPGKAT